MPSYVFKRLLQAPLTLLGVLTILFVILRLIPGDPAVLILREEATPEAIEELRESLGLNEPLVVQYGKFITDLLRGDLGNSLRTQRDVVGEIVRVAPHTLLLACGALSVAVALGTPLGVMAATGRGKMRDVVATAIALLGASAPVFVVAIVLILVVGYHWQALPMIGSGDLSDPTDVAARLVLPSVSIGVAMAGQIARMTRSSVLEVLEADFVRTARAKGASGIRVLWKHTLRNALLPVVTIVSLNFGVLLAGAVVTESVFARAGLGRMLIDAIFARDYPMIQGIVAIFAAGFILLNLVTDVVYAVLDPRVRYD